MTQDKVIEKNGKKGEVASQLPRGVRNNNPGNLVRNKIAWEGMAADQPDPKFVRFNAPVWGLRAMMKVLLSYQKRHGLKTVDAIIRRWAPAVENKTSHYIWHVARQMGVSHLQKLNLQNPAVLIALARAITLHENGNPPDPQVVDWYPDEVYERAASLALGFVPHAMG